MRSAAIAMAALLLSGRAWADPFPSRSGGSGVLDVPVASSLDRGEALFGGELRWAHRPGEVGPVGPSRLTAAAGLGLGFELAFAARDADLPGDPRPSPPLFGANLKFRVIRPAGWRPGVALDAGVDRVNDRPRSLARLIVSTDPERPFRLAAYGGAMAHGPRPYAYDWLAGVAASYVHSSGFELAAEAAKGWQGRMVGGALRWRFGPSFGVGLGGSWLPDDKAYAVALSVGVFGSMKRKDAKAKKDPADEEDEEEAAAPPPVRRKAFSGDTPRLRLRLDEVRVPDEDAGEHRQFPEKAAEEQGAPEGEEGR